jgi:hypothetical protein
MESKFLYLSLGSPVIPEFKKNKSFEPCCICGQEQGNIKKTEIIGGSFTNLDLLRNTNESICNYCAIVAKEPLFRRSSFVAYEDKIVEMKREEIANNFFNVGKAPFCFYVTTSFKKLGQWKVKLNNDINNFTLQFEELKVGVNITIAKTMYDIIEDFYSIKKGDEEKKQPSSWFSKDEIKLGNYKMYKIREYGINNFQEKENQIKEYRTSPLFNFLIYICNKKVKNNETIPPILVETDKKDIIVDKNINNKVDKKTNLVQETFF